MACRCFDCECARISGNVCCVRSQLNLVRKSNYAFTIIELLVSVAVLVVLVLLVSRLFSSAATITTSGNKRMTADAQLRPLFDRMAIDFSQMVKRSDVDYYLKSSSNAQNGNESDTPWDTSAGHISVSGMQDVAALSLALAVIDPKSRVLISDSQLNALAARLPDFSTSMRPGDLLNRWQAALDGTTDMARPGIQSVRIYERYFYLLPK